MARESRFVGLAALVAGPLAAQSVSRSGPAALGGQASFAGFYRPLWAHPNNDPSLKLRDAIQRIALEFTSFGWAFLTEDLRRRGWTANHERVYRLMREAKVDNPKHLLRLYRMLDKPLNWNRRAKKLDQP